MPDIELLTPPPHPVLTSLCRLISDRLGADLAIVTDAQHCVLASHSWPLSLSVPPLAALMTADMLVLTDTTQDPRFEPLADAMGSFQTGFYAASILRSPEGEVLGYLYLLRQRPRTFERQHYQVFLDAICLASEYLVHQNALKRAAQVEARLLPLESGVESVTDAMLTYNTAGRITYANPAAANLFGSAGTNLEGQLLTELIPGGLDSLPHTNSETWQVGQAEGLTQDGVILHLEVVSRQLQVDGKQSTLLIRNISEQQGAVTALAQSQLHTQALLHAIPDTLLVLSKEGLVVSYKPDSLSLPRDPVGRSIYQLWSLETAGLIMLYLNLTLQGNQRSRAFMLQPPLGSQDGLTLEGRLMPMGSERALLVVRNLTVEQPGNVWEGSAESSTAPSESESPPQDQAPPVNPKERDSSN